MSFTSEAATPRVFLALRQLPVQQQSGLVQSFLETFGSPIVCLTKEAKAFATDASVPFLQVQKNASITKNDILIVNLVLPSFDVFLHSLIRSSCEKHAVVVCDLDDLKLLSEGKLNDEPTRELLYKKALEYCAGFDHSLAKRGFAHVKQNESTKSVFEFESPDSAFLSSLFFAVDSKTTTSVDVKEDAIHYSIGLGKGDEIGPSAEAQQIASRSAPDQDIEDEVWDLAYVFFSDGEQVFPSEEELIVPCLNRICPSRGSEATEADLVKCKQSALASANRVIDSCAFSDSPYKGPLVLLVSRRGRVVQACFDDVSIPLGDIFARVQSLEIILAACATSSFGYHQLATLSSPISSSCITVPRKLRLAALGSTPGGSSLQPILDSIYGSQPQQGMASMCEVNVVVSDKENSGVVKRAQVLGIPGLTLSAKGKTRQEFDARVTDELERRGVDLIVLVGYMRIVSDEFCRKWDGRILNVHPSLLPDFAGGMDLQVHTAVLAAKKTESGCTVHLVTEVVDGGPIVLQKRCEVLVGTDTPESLKARVQALEGPCLIESILHFAKREGIFATNKLERLTYEAAGVSTSRGDEVVERIKNFCKATKRRGCDPDLGGFGACFDLHSLGYVDPIMVSGTDGVGTKLILAQELKEETTVGVDLVAMSVNDLIVQGAEPMFFLDYFASGRLNLDQAPRIISGIAHGCALANCALIGGETAEMPGMYKDGVYDLAGFAFGVVERAKLLPKQVREGDVLIGLRSSGVHSNGYSLVRKVVKGMDLNKAPPFPSTQPTMKDVLLEPTRIYWKSLKRVIERDLIQALAHITGSGIPGNLPRVFDESSLYAEVDLTSWEPQEIFKFLARTGPITQDEMLSTFNCGIGMIIICSEDKVSQIMDLLPLEDGPCLLGRMKRKTQPTDASVQFTGMIASFPQSVPVEKAVTYSQAGVDIIAGDSFVDQIKSGCKSTKRAGCMALDLGGFGSLFDLKELNNASSPESVYDQPVIVSGTDGVGTKLLLAQNLNIHDTVGIDLVAMSVNDLIVQGAEPLFFLDYFACGKLDIPRAVEVVNGIVEGCRQSECALVGGETAEMPGMYPVEEYDLAGFACGIVNRSRLLPKASEDGDVLIGLKSSGVHSNGFSLVRKILDKSKVDVHGPCPFDSTRDFAHVLLEPTKIYWKLLKPMLREGLIVGMAHITGSGIPGNLPRVFTEQEYFAEIDMKSWEPTSLYKWLQQQGNCEWMEMLNTFNCGLGMILLCRGEDNVKRVLELAGEETVGVIGKLKRKADKEDQSVVFVNMWQEENEAL